MDRKVPTPAREASRGLSFLCGFFPHTCLVSIVSVLFCDTIICMKIKLLFLSLFSLFLFFAFSYNASATVNSFTANPTSVNSGGFTTLFWTSNSTTGCDTWANPVRADWNTLVSSSSNQSVGPINVDTTFTIFCAPTPTSTRNLTVTVNAPAPTASISASPSTISAGETTTITWSSTNSTSCTATNGASGWSGAKGPSGTQDFDLYANTTFTIQCTNGTTNSNPASVGVSVNGFSSLLSVSANPGGSSSIALSGGSRANPISTTASTAQFELSPSGISSSAWLCQSSSFSQTSWSSAPYGPWTAVQNPNAPSNMLFSKSLSQTGYYDFLVAYSAESFGSSCGGAFQSALIRIDKLASTGTI